MRQFGYLIPYTYPIYNYLKSGVETKAVIPDVNIHLFAIGYFIVITAVSYLMYLGKREKG